MSFANLFKDPDEPWASRVPDVDVFLTAAEWRDMRDDFAQVSSEEGVADALARHVGQDFVPVVRTCFFRVSFVEGSRADDVRWRFLG